MYFKHIADIHEKYCTGEIRVAAVTAPVAYKRREEMKRWIKGWIRTDSSDNLLGGQVCICGSACPCSRH